MPYLTIPIRTNTVPTGEKLSGQAGGRRLLRILAFAAVLAAYWPAGDVLAHGGGLDGLGCHHNRKLGGYHCHRGPLAGQSFGSKSEAIRALEGSRPQATPAPGPQGDTEPEPAQATITGRASVIDGDTLEIHGQRIRLHGIDAPESAQPCVRADGTRWRCGQQASLALADRIGQAPVTCRRTDTDHYGRMIAVCLKGTEDLNAWLVAEGWAVAYRRYSNDYVELEEQTRAAGRNIWSSQFVMPWDWRGGQRIGEREATEERQHGCGIKGNISSRGERIYHVPGGQYYDRTRISSSKGERWFCSEEEARAAGWRKAKR